MGVLIFGGEVEAEVIDFGFVEDEGCFFLGLFLLLWFHDQL